MSRISGNASEKLRRERKRCQIGDIIKTRKRKFIVKRTSDFEGINALNKCNYCSFWKTIMCFKYSCVIDNGDSFSPVIFTEIE